MGYYEGYHAAKSESSGWSEFFGFLVTVFCIWMVAGWIADLAKTSERERIEELLRPYGVTIEHLEKQAEIAKAKKLAQPLDPLICVQGTCATVEKTR